jgi:hypothetical protein
MGIAIINFGPRHETVDLNRVSALDLDLLDLVVLDVEVLTPPDFIAAADLFIIDDVAGFGVNHLLLKPIAGVFVDTVERDPFGARRRRIERDRTRHERQLEVAFPVGARGHGKLLTTIPVLTEPPKL